ncbi:MAG: hypothetical protein ABL999_10545 [Pyrinomonadaceae bacterium]
MLETVEATIDPLGNVRFKEKISRGRFRKGYLTILDEEPVQVEEDVEWSLAGSAVLLKDDLESGRKRFVEEFDAAMDRSAEELKRED